MYCPVFQVVRVGTPRSPSGEALGPQPVSEPGHVAIAVEGVGDQVEGSQGHQRVEGPGGHAADPVGVQAQTLYIDQALDKWKTS